MKDGVTIVIPGYNRANVIHRTLNSVKAQTYRPLNVVLVDNGSTDNTLEIMHQWAEQNKADDFCCYVIEEHRKGACAARNAGLELVDTEWTMFFDSDDEMLPYHVERAMNAAKENHEIDLWGWNVIMRSTDGKDRIKPFCDKSVYVNCIQHGTLATQRYMARTAIIKAAGGWREDLMAWNDIELGVRILNQRPRIKKLHGEISVIIHNSGAASITGIGFLHNHQNFEYSLDCIEKSLPQEMRWIVSVKMAVLAGLYRREKGYEQSQRLMKKAVENETNPRIRLACQWACWHTSKGLPGAAKIISCLMPKY